MPDPCLTYFEQSCTVEEQGPTVEKSLLMYELRVNANLATRGVPAS